MSKPNKEKNKSTNIYDVLVAFFNKGDMFRFFLGASILYSVITSSPADRIEILRTFKDSLEKGYGWVIAFLLSLIFVIGLVLVIFLKYNKKEFKRVTDLRDSLQKEKSPHPIKSSEEE